ncbi:uncharacterized protein [Henckelia pumila]|uniref:uncharacterized protein n=1 Tax=Henckelia pumila TaxID=405737 RepID=UPI003C6E210F
MGVTKALRKTKNFEWDEESEKAFQDLKAYLKQLFVLNKPTQREELFLYLAVTPRAASSVLVRKQGINHQPIYFFSHTLKGAELNYLTQEKVSLALVITTRKLRPYFLSHPIIVLTNNALGKIAANPDASGRLVRSSCQTGSEAGIFIISPWSEENNISVRLDFRASNNEAEYEALLLRLKAAQNMGISRATIYSDSQLAIKQSNGKFEIKDEKMMKYAKALDKFKEGFTELDLELIPRAENIMADHLARLASALSDRPDPIVSGRELVSQLETLDDIIAQKHAKLQWRPAEYMKAVVVACPFDQWGMDIVGPLPVSTGQRKFLLVEVANRTIIKALKTRLDIARGKWVEELSSVLWPYRTTTRSGTGKTPFSMVYGTEAVLPAEIGQESARIIEYGENNQELRAMDLDLLVEHKTRAAIRLAFNARE